MRRLLATVVLLLPALAAAQARSLTLEEALASAEKRSPSLDSARAGVAVAEATVDQAWSPLRPTVTAQGKYTHNYREIEFDLGGGQTAVLLKGEQLDASIAAGVPLLAPPAYKGLTSARRSLDAANADYQTTRTAVLFSVAQAFFLAAGSDELAVARKHAVEVATKTVNDAQARRNAGAATGVEVQRAEIALVRAQQALEEAEYARGQAYRTLTRLIELREPFVVAAPADEDLPSPEDAVKLALKLRPELHSLEMNIAADQAQVESDRWRWAPTLSAFGSAHVGNYAGFGGDYGSWAVGLELDWTIYDGGVRDAQRHIAAARVNDTDARLRLEREVVSDEVTDAVAALTVKRNGLVADKHALDLAARTLDQVRAQHEAGTATQLDLLSAQDSLVQAEVDVARARLDLELARVTLARATGTFPGPGPARR